MFDVEQAIQARLAETPPDMELTKAREEGPKHFRVDSLRAQQALGMIEIAGNALKHDLTEEQKAFEMTRMAEGYYLLGKFEDAFLLSADPLKQKEYQDAMLAKTEKCRCPMKSGRDAQGRHVELDPRFLIDTFPGKKLFKCSDCSSFHVEKTR